MTGLNTLQIPIWHVTSKVHISILTCIQSSETFILYRAGQYIEQIKDVSPNREKVSKDELITQKMLLNLCFSSRDWPHSFNE